MSLGINSPKKSVKVIDTIKKNKTNSVAEELSK